MTTAAIFRVDGGRRIGYGHIYRCLVLADALINAGLRSTFVTRSHEGHLAEVIKERGHEVIVLPANETAGSDPLTWLGDVPRLDAGVTSEIAAERRASIVVADHYGVDFSWTRAVRRLVSKLVVIDDLANRQLDCDVLINQNLGAEHLPYKGLLGTESILLLGTTYALLSPAFVNARKVRCQAIGRSPAEQRLVVALGGSDPTNATSHVLKSLAPLAGRTLRVDVVIGRAHPVPESVQAHAAVFRQSQVHVQAPPKAMAELLARADAAIGAGGSSALERLCVGVPSVIVEVAANQRSTVDELAKSGFAIPYRLGRDSDDYLANQVTRLLMDDHLRDDIRRRGQERVDGQGSQRVARTIVGLMRSASPS